MSDRDDWQQTFEDRRLALERVLGKTDGNVLHASVPFQFGGQADVLVFPNHVPGQVAATCELLGNPSQVRNKLGTYELIVAQRDAHDWGPTVVSNVARYTCESRVEPGHTMDLGGNFPKRSTMAGLLFLAYRKFEYAGGPAGLLLCMSITADEMAAVRAGKRKAVFDSLKAAGVVPYSDLFRVSVSL